MTPRDEYALRFADGGLLRLGRQTAVMGVLNVTPDSFSDGGAHPDVAQALAAARRMAAAGAAIVDVGGESTRPGAAEVSLADELARVLPVVEALKAALAVRVSVDTRKAEAARRALAAGADMVNDVSALADPEMAGVVAEAGAALVLMHMRGTPRTMQRATRYADLIGEVTGFLGDRLGSAVAAGVADDKIVLDPGIGFGKDVGGNLRILNELPAMRELGRPILIGASRKTFIGKILDLPVEDRLEGSLAAAAFASAQGAHVIRAHDVAATVRAVRLIDALRAADREA